MNNAHKVHGVEFTSVGKAYSSKHIIKSFSSQAAAEGLAKKMTATGNTVFNSSAMREVKKNSLLRFDLTGSSGTSYVVLYLYQMKDEFLIGEPVSNLPTMVMGDMKSFITVVSCSEKHVILKVDIAEVRKQSDRIKAADHPEHKHGIVTLPVCLNLVHEPFNTSLPVLGHPDEQAGNDDDDHDHDHDHPLSIASPLGHGGFHPPVVYVNV